VIEKDNIQELFSKAFENHSSSVRPDLWAGVQAKMSAAGVAGGSVAVKGISALTKWIVGTAAVTTIGVVTYVVTNSDEPIKPNAVANTTQNTTNTPIANNKINAVPDNNKVIANNSTQTTNPSPEIRFVVPTVTDPTDSHPPFIEIAPMGDPFSTGNMGNKVDPAKSTVSNTGGDTSPAQSKDDHTAASPNSTENSVGNEAYANTVKKEAKLELPNIFTPNGDGANDFCKFIKIENVKSVEITIFDQNNNPVFKSDDLAFAWDGTLASGDQARIGIYMVSIVYTDLEDNTKSMKARPIYLQR